MTTSLLSQLLVECAAGQTRPSAGGGRSCPRAKQDTLWRNRSKPSYTATTVTTTTTTTTIIVSREDEDVRKRSIDRYGLLQCG